MSEDSTQIPTGGDQKAASRPEIVLRSEELFMDRTEIVIVHKGERYRLRLTKRGKLILQK